MNMFETASRKLFRYQTIRGLVSTDDLWNMPLSSNNGFDLDNVAKAIHQEIQTMSVTSFVTTSSNSAKKDELEVKLEIVKHIIADKLEQKAKRENAAAKATERQALLEVLNKKEQSALENLTPEQIKAKIAALDS